MYTIHAYDRVNSFFNTKSAKTLELVEEKQETDSENDTQSLEEPSSSTSLLEDNWGSLDLTPTFIGEYQFSDLSFMQPQTKNDKESTTTPLFDDLSNKFVATIANESLDTIKPNFYVIVIYEASLTLFDMASRYGPSYHLLTKYGFNGNRYRKIEQGIQVPLEKEAHEHFYG